MMVSKLLIAALILLISGCAQQNPEKGVLHGKITIGPICPVERIPPDPGCQPTAETYKAWPIAIWTKDKTAKVAQIEPDLKGNYRLELPAGTYVADLDRQNGGVGGSNLPSAFTIKPGENTTLEIDIDTGIR
jgi:hypothetical protein